MEFLFECETLNINFMGVLMICFNFKVEQWRLVMLDNRLNFHCHATDNQTYRAVQFLYVICMSKSEFL